MIHDLLTHEKVRDEYSRCLSKVGVEDSYAGKYTIGLHDTLDAHYLLADFFFGVGEGMGGIGPKSVEMLHSSLSRQFVQFNGKPKYTDRLDVCATLMYGLIKNHPFYDANKRTAFLISLLHLQKIGRTPTVDHKGYEDFTVSIAENSLSKYLPKDVMDGEDADRDVKTVSWFLKRNTRAIETGVRSVSYNDLKVILSKRGLGFERPEGNRIDLVRYDETHSNTRPSFVRLARVGFHSWTSEVSRKDLKDIRRAAGLDAKHGYDNLSFYGGLDGPLELIKKYREPLERLAYR